MNRVAVVVLNYKRIHDTIICLESLSRQTYKDLTIVVVENGSHDTSVAELRKLKKKYGKKLHTLYNEANLGFTGGANTGIRWAMEHHFDSVALFNNDATADSRWLEELVSAQRSEHAGITTGLLLHEDGQTIDSTGDWYTTWGLPFPRNRNDALSEAPKAGQAIFSGSGGASLYSMRLFDEIGLFDETFFAYYEDVDISFRAQLAGWKVIYTPNAIAYHKQGATSNMMPSGFSVYQTFKNLPLLFIKNVPRGLLVSIGVRFWFAYLMMLGNAVKKGKGKAAFKGYLKSIVLWWTSALPARWHTQAGKQVKTSYIKSILWPDLPPDQTGLRKLRRLLIGK